MRVYVWPQHAAHLARLRSSKCLALRRSACWEKKFGKLGSAYSLTPPPKSRAWVRYYDLNTCSITKTWAACCGRLLHRAFRECFGGWRLGGCLTLSFNPETFEMLWATLLTEYSHQACSSSQRPTDKMATDTHTTGLVGTTKIQYQDVNRHAGYKVAVGTILPKTHKFMLTLVPRSQKTFNPTHAMNKATAHLVVKFCTNLEPYPPILPKMFWDWVQGLEGLLLVPPHALQHNVASRLTPRSLSAEATGTE